MASPDATSPSFTGFGIRRTDWGPLKSALILALITLMVGGYLGWSARANFVAVNSASVTRPCDKFPPPCTPVTSSTSIVAPDAGKAPGSP